MPARTDTSFTVREEGFDHLRVGYRTMKDSESYPDGFIFDIECEQDAINLELSLDGAECLAESILALVAEAKGRNEPTSTQKPITKPKK